MKTERVNRLGDETYFLILDGCCRSSRLALELEEAINNKDISADILKYLFESIILSIKEGVREKYSLLRLYKKVQEEYGVTNAPREG